MRPLKHSSRMQTRDGLSHLGFAFGFIWGAGSLKVGNDDMARPRFGENQLAPSSMLALCRAAEPGALHITSCEGPETALLPTPETLQNKRGADGQQ